MLRVVALVAAVYLSTLAAVMPAAQSQDGKAIFRFDTFGSEQLWTDVLRMQHVISDSVSPATALSVGLKVDADALPPDLIAALQKADLVAFLKTL